MNDVNTVKNDVAMDELEKTIMSMMDGLTTYAEARQISHEQLEGVYRVGHTYYMSGKLVEAEQVFKFLCALSHTTTKYWVALGAARQELGKYQEALLAYATAGLYEPTKPKAHYYAAECNFALGELELALSGANSVLALCPAGTPENNQFRAKAEALKRTIEKKMEVRHED